MSDMQVGGAVMGEVSVAGRIVESLGFEDTVTVNVLKLFVEKMLARKSAVNALALPVRSTVLFEGAVQTVWRGRRH